MRIRSIASIAKRLSDALKLLLAGGALVLALSLPALAMHGGSSGGGMSGGRGSAQNGAGGSGQGHMMDMEDMHRGWTRQYPQGPQVQPGQGELNREQARSMAEEYVRGTNNPNIRVGKISEKQGYFEVPVATKDGSLVDTLRIDKQTGEFSSASGQ
ncbi:hypothetical protein [Desulfocurvibacter africanus]|uniref:hypothetical protein n=1 Tax=Desulfocurvibacter africanus TaxID=873 RepID=UPI00040B39EB|nr:hypothetical protein [Desulfocurvibacter africanus]